RKIGEISSNLKHIISLLGVVGRYLEIIIFEMAILGFGAKGNKNTLETKFYHEGYRYFLENCQYDHNYCTILLRRVKDKINRTYSRYYNAYTSQENIEIIPQLLAYTLFVWEVTRTTTLGKRKIQDLEIDELIFLNKDKLVLPFVTLQQVYHYFDHNKLPAIKLLQFVENTLSSDENEALTLSTMVFRLWGIYYKSISDKKIIEGQRGNCWLSDLVPLRKGQSDKFIEFEPKFVVHSTPYRVDKDYWIQFFNNYLKELNKKCIAFHNLPNASFSDGIIITDPPIFIQDKQEVISRKKEIIGHLPNIRGKGVVKFEHQKVLDANVGKHIFVFITDAHARNDETYYNNEVVITSGDILAKMKLYSIGRS
ncbi:1794_t:CDS:2, partial [Funneliformis geosporum]